METITVPLSAEQKAFIEAQAAECGLMSPADYVRHLIQQAEAMSERARIEALIVEGLESGPPTPFTDQDWKEIEHEVFGDPADSPSKRREQSR